MKKKINYNEKTKKIFVQKKKIGMGYCPFVLQEKKICIVGSKAKLYYKRWRNCIAIW